MASVCAHPKVVSLPLEDQSEAKKPYSKLEDLYNKRPRRQSWLSKSLEPLSQLLRNQRQKRRQQNYKLPFMEWLRTNKRKILICFIASFISIPLLLTSIGAIVEHITYGQTNAPRYHVKNMAFASIVAAFLIFMRWIWPKDHLMKLEIVIYAMSLAGFATTLSISVISGETLFYTSEHIRSIFGGEQFSAISTRKSVYDWLEAALVRVFEDQKDKTWESTNILFRLLPGRVALFGPVRLKQSRSKTKPCATLLHELNLPGLDTGSTKCYSKYDIDNADTTPYSALNFTYFNPTYLNYAGVKISAHDITTRGTFGTYPLSGFWVVWPPNQTLITVLSMVEDLKENKWIDDHTREISLDFNIMMLDLSHVIVANVFYMVETAPSGRYLGQNARLSFNFYAEKLSDHSEKGNNCGGDVDIEEEFFAYAYYGILPFITYWTFVTVLEIWRNWRRHLKRLFTWLEIAWLVTSSMAIVFRWQAIYYGHCNHLEYAQEVWSTGGIYQVEFFELKAISDYWLLSRQSVSVSFFLLMINFLQFVTRLHTLDVLTKTIERAFRELASFAFSFLVVFFAFVILFYFMFSMHSKDYQSLGRTIVTLWTAMLGDIKITEGMHLNRSWAIPLLILFTFTFVFVLLTVIIAIISNAHEQVRSQRGGLKESGRGNFPIDASTLLEKLKLKRDEASKPMARHNATGADKTDEPARCRTVKNPAAEESDREWHMD